MRRKSTIADLMKFTGEQFPVTGTLRTNVNLHGSVMNPEGSGKVDLTDVTAYQQPVNSIGSISPATAPRRRQISQCRRRPAACEATSRCSRSSEPTPRSLPRPESTSTSLRP